METALITKEKENIYSQEVRDFVLDEGFGGTGKQGEKQYVLRLRDLPVEEKPREKLLKFGPGTLSMSELLMVVFGTGTKKEDVRGMSQRLLKEYGESVIVNQKDPKKIQEALGIPLVKACQVVACFELGRRFFKTAGAKKPLTVRTARQVFEYLKDMRELSKEHLRGLYLDSHYQLIHDEMISVGSLTTNIVHPREVFRPALEYAASAVILAHNHPSGVATPSEADVAITRQIVEAGKILGISLLDHVVITKTKFESVGVDY
ncbi:MAG TPA: DNA repair protein RadC [Candidatus Paceibacterota bacterium]|jgi:DNA repair protein RadC|nr:DNA repair protein RadC [Candidatus Paceibacterota bacterium]